MHPVGVVGNLSLDSVQGAPPRIGGGSYYAARGLAQAGRPCRVVARCANADRELLAPALQSLGVPAVVLGGDSTARFSLRYDGEQREAAVDGIGDAWTVDDARRAAEALGEFRWVHVAPLLRSDFPTEALVELARGRTLSLDGQGLVRRPRLGPLELDRAYDPALLESVSILKLAEEEALVVAGGLEPAALAALGVPEIVVTQGSRGSLVCTGGHVEHVAADPLADVDPTGAGDAFAAAYLGARAEGADPVDAAVHATAVVHELLETGLESPRA